MPVNELLPRETIHLCIDMQQLFGPGAPWATPWMERVLPTVTEIVAAQPERTVFTRFIPPERPEEMPGMWQSYYRKWHNVTRQEMDSKWLDLMELLTKFTPPARVIDKTRYSAFAGTQLPPFRNTASAACW
jgi:nicotinamidase-related amidase